MTVNPRYKLKAKKENKLDLKTDYTTATTTINLIEQKKEKLK